MSVEELPKEGDICPSCKDEHGDNPKRLVLIGTTQNHKILVPACPYCDGERALALAARRKAQGLPNDD